MGINGPYTVVDEAGAEQNCKCENFQIDILVVFRIAEALRVDHNYIHRLAWTSEAFNRLTKDPEPFGASVDSSADSESVCAVKENSVEQVALPSAIHSCHRKDRDWTFDLWDRLCGFFWYLELWSGLLS